MLIGGERSLKASAVKLPHNDRIAHSAGNEPAHNWAMMLCLTPHWREITELPPGYSLDG
jgi:hypothetical protein